MSSLGTLGVLPLEVRTNIYTQLFRSTTVPFNVEHSRKSLNKCLAVLVVSRQICAEASPLLVEHVNVVLMKWYFSIPHSVVNHPKRLAREYPHTLKMGHFILPLEMLDDPPNTGSGARMSAHLVARIFPALNSITLVIQHDAPRYKETIWGFLGCGFSMARSRVGFAWEGKLKYDEDVGKGTVREFIDGELPGLSVAVRREGWKHQVRVHVEMALTPRKACRWEISKDWAMKMKIVRKKNMAASGQYIY